MESDERRQVLARLLEAATPRMAMLQETAKAKEQEVHQMRRVSTSPMTSRMPNRCLPSRRNWRPGRQLSGPLP